MKKLFAVLLALALVIALAACGNNTPKNESSAAVANPITQSSAEEIKAQLGVDMTVPEGATDITYTIIAGETAQVDFTLNKLACNYRITKADALTDISGMYYEWATKKGCKIGSFTGEINFNEGKEGFCNWYDDTAKLLHSVSVDSGATEASLLALADSLA